MQVEVEDIGLEVDGVQQEHRSYIGMLVAEGEDMEQEEIVIKQVDMELVEVEVQKEDKVFVLYNIGKKHNAQKIIS